MAKYEKQLHTPGSVTELLVHDMAKYEKHSHTPGSVTVVYDVTLTITVT